MWRSGTARSGNAHMFVSCEHGRCNADAYSTYRLHKFAHSTCESSTEEKEQKRKERAWAYVSHTWPEGAILKLSPLLNPLANFDSITSQAPRGTSSCMLRWREHIRSLAWLCGSLAASPARLRAPQSLQLRRSMHQRQRRRMSRW